MTAKIRLNLELAPPTKERLDRLLKRTEAESMTEIIRRSLAENRCLLEEL